MLCFSSPNVQSGQVYYVRLSSLPQIHRRVHLEERVDVETLAMGTVGTKAEAEAITHASTAADFMILI